MSALYDLGRDAFANKLIDWVNDSIKISLVGSGYVANMSTDQYYSSVSGVIGAPILLASRSTSAGVCDAADVTSASLSTGSTVTQAVIFVDTGTPATSRLIARIDLTSTPTNGGTLTIAFDNGVNRIFKL